MENKIRYKSQPLTIDGMELPFYVPTTENDPEKALENQIFNLKESLISILSE